MKKITTKLTALAQTEVTGIDYIAAFSVLAVLIGLRIWLAYIDV